MQPVSTFRGTCGEVVSQYISPMTFVPALPIAAGILISGWVGRLFGGFGSYVSLVLICVLASVAIMRFALPSSRGDMEPSNDFGEISVYVGRFLLLNLTWFVPWVLFWVLLSKNGNQISPLVLVNPLSLLQSPLVAYLKILLIAMLMVCPPLCLLVVLYCSSTKGMYSRHSWNWLFKQRRYDLAPYWGSLVGGCATMILAALIPFLVLMVVAIKFYPQLSYTLAQILIAWVAGSMVVLFSQLSGAFVSHDHIDLDFVMKEFPSLLVAEEAPIAPPTQHRPLEVRPDLSEIEKRLSALDVSEFEGALGSARELETSESSPLRGQIEQTLLLLRSGDGDAAREVAARAINAASRRGFSDICQLMFEKFGTDRRKLKLEPYSLELLGAIYQKRKQLLDAAWCLHAAASITGDTIKAQKRLFQIAEIAEKDGNLKDAEALYGILVKQYPDSTLIEFARQGAERTRGTDR